MAGAAEVTAQITITGLAEAMRGLGLVAQDLESEAAKRAALETIAIAKPEPAASRNRQPFKTAKSRKFFFAALRSGQLTVPYRRSHSLQDAWAWQPAPGGAQVTNASPHADVTIVKATRSAYHKPTWPDEYQIADKATQPARDAAEIGIVRLLAQADF